MQLPGWLRRVRREISLSRWLYTPLRSRDLDEVFFLSFFFFFWWGFLNQSTLCRPQSRGSQRIRHSWATQQQKSPYTSQCLEDPFRKEKYLVNSLPCGTRNTNFRSKEVSTKRKESKWHRSKHSHRTEQCMSEDSGKGTADEWNWSTGWEQKHLSCWCSPILWSTETEIYFLYT